MKKLVLGLLLASAVGLGGYTVYNSRSATLKPATAQELQSEVMNTSISFVLAKSESCEACKTMTPMFEKTAKKNRGKAAFILADVDKIKELQEQVPAIPTLVVLDMKIGGVIGVNVGAAPSQEVLDRYVEETIKGLQEAEKQLGQ